MRTHIGRDIDLRHRPNLVIALLTVAAAVAGLVVGLDSGTVSLTWQTPAHVFLIWALLREIDPDHEWLAIVGGLGAGLWILTGGDVTTALATAGFMVAARLVVFSTGRRPLPTDLAVISLAALLGYTTEGWGSRLCGGCGVVRGRPPGRGTTRHATVGGIGSRSRGDDRCSDL